MDLAPTQVYEDEFLPTQRITYGINEEETVQVGVLTIASVPYPIQKGINKIGRHPDCDIVLNNETVSKYHAEIEADVGPGSTFICDLVSSNKTKLNNLFLRPQRAYELKDGDSVKFGQVSAVYKVCRLNEFPIPETPASKHSTKNQCIIPGTPDTSLEVSIACSENASVIDDSHIIQDDKNDIFRRPSLPFQRNSVGTSKSSLVSSCTDHDKPENSYVPVARKISMSDSDTDISELETQKFPDFNSRKESDIHEMETQQFSVNDVVKKNSNTTVQTENSRDVEEANNAATQDEESIHDLETQRQSPHVEESIHDVETQNFDFGAMPRRSGVSQNGEEDIHDFETQKIDIARIRQREAGVSVDDEEQNDGNDIHDFETQKIDIARIRQREAGDSVDDEEQNDGNDIHDFETQKIDITRIRQIEAGESVDDEEQNDRNDIHDFETQKIDIARIRQREAGDSVDDREQNDGNDIHDFETQKIDIARIRQREAGDSVDDEDQNDIHDSVTQKIDMAQMKEEEAKSSVDNERLNSDEDIFDGEQQLIDVQKAASSAMFDIESQKNVIQKEASIVGQNPSDLETIDTEKETAQTLVNVPTESANNENNPAHTTESSVIDNNETGRQSNDRSAEHEALNTSQKEGGVNGNNSVDGSQDLLKGYVEEAYFSSDEMSVKQSTPERPSTSNTDGKISLVESPDISDNEESIFDAPTQRVLNTTQAASDSETDEENVFQQNYENETNNPAGEVGSETKVPNDPTSLSDDSETDEEGLFIEMASREEESSIVDKERIENMSDRDDSAESIDIFEAATQKVEVNTKTEKVKPSKVLGTDFVVEFPDQDIFCVATQNANNVEENTIGDRENNSRSEEILPEKSNANANDDEDNIVNEDRPDLEAALKTSNHIESIPEDIDDMAPTQLMELPESPSRVKDNDLSRPTTSGIITEDYDLLPTQIMDEELRDVHENIQKNSGSENNSEINHKVIHAEEGFSKGDDNNIDRLVEIEKKSPDLSNENNTRPNGDTSVIKTLNVTEQKDDALNSSSPKDTNVTKLEVVHMEIDETLPSQLIHLQKLEERENTSLDRLSTSMERNEDDVMHSTALDDHSIREIIGVPRDEDTSLLPRDASVEDLEYELAPTQLISEVEKTAEGKPTSRNVSIVKTNRRKAKSRGPCRVNLNDTIERNLNDMFDGANDGQIEEPQQMSTQHLEIVLQASQDNSITNEALPNDNVLPRSPLIGSVKRKRPRIVKGKNQDNDADSQEKYCPNLTVKNKLLALRESQESSDSGLASTNKGTSSKNISATDSQESSNSSQETNKYFSYLTTKRKRNVIRDSQNSENLCENGASFSDDRKSLEDVDEEVENKRVDVYRNVSDKDLSKNEIDKVDRYLISDDKNSSEMGRKSVRIGAKSRGIDSSQDKEEKGSKIIMSSDDSQNSTISNVRPKRNLRKAKSSAVDLKGNVLSENVKSLSSTESSTREEEHIYQYVNKNRNVRMSESTSESNTVMISNVSDDSQSSGISKVRPKRNLRKTVASKVNKEDTPVVSKDLTKSPTVQRSEDIDENVGAKSSDEIKDDHQEKITEPNDDEDFLAGLPAVTIYGTASIPGSPSASSTSTVHEIRPSSKQKKGKSRIKTTRQTRSRRTSLGIDEEPFRVVRKMDSPNFAQQKKNLETFSSGISHKVLEANQEVRDDDDADDSDDDLRNIKELASKILSVKGTYTNKDLSQKKETEETTKKDNKVSMKKNDIVLSKNNVVDSTKNRSDFTISLRNTRSTRQSSKKVDENSRDFQIPEEPPPSTSISENLANIANNRKRPPSVLSLDESTSNTRSKRLKKSGTEEKANLVNKSRTTRRKKGISNAGRESPSILNYLTQNNSSKSTFDSSSVDENTSESNTTGQSFESSSQTSEKSVQRGKRKAASTANNSVAEVSGKKMRNTANKFETSNESFSSSVSSRLENNPPSLSLQTPTKSQRNMSMSMTRSPSSAKHKILFTGLPDNEYAKILKGLGGLKVEDPMKCTVLVTDKVRRTLKFLCALAQGTPIVSIEWLNESQTAGYFLDWESFLLKDPATEAKFGFKLAKSLKRAKQQRLLEGYTIVLTPNVAPPPIPELKSMIQTCGGKVLTRAPVKWPEKSVIVSSEEDITNARKFLSKAPNTVTIQSKEFILTGILQQELNFVKNRLQ